MCWLFNIQSLWILNILYENAILNWIFLKFGHVKSFTGRFSAPNSNFILTKQIVLVLRGTEYSDFIITEFLTCIRIGRLYPVQGSGLMPCYCEEGEPFSSPWGRAAEAPKSLLGSTQINQSRRVHATQESRLRSKIPLGSNSVSQSSHCPLKSYYLFSIHSGTPSPSLPRLPQDPVLAENNHCNSPFYTLQWRAHTQPNFAMSNALMPFGIFQHSQANTRNVHQPQAAWIALTKS